MTVNDEINGAGGVMQQPLTEVDEDGGVRVFLVDGERSALCADTTEIMFTEYRASVFFTCGVWPAGD